jgi:2-haloacid dehalogenase
MKTGPAFIFDLGGVLLDWDRRHLYRKIFAGDPEKLDYFLTHICSLEWNLRMDRGYPFTQAVEELAQQHPEWEEPIRHTTADGGDAARADRPTVAILRSLKQAGYPVCALSNWSAETSGESFELRVFRLV